DSSGLIGRRFDSTRGDSNAAGIFNEGSSCAIAGTPEQIISAATENSMRVRMRRPLSIRFPLSVRRCYQSNRSKSHSLGLQQTLYSSPQRILAGHQNRL